MARRHSWRGVAPRRSLSSALQTRFYGRPTATRRRTFSFECLEDRLAMDGDNSLAAGALVPQEVSNIAAYDVAQSLPTSSQTDVAELHERFQSTEDFRAWLMEAAVAQWGHMFGNPQHSVWYWDHDYVLIAPAFDAGPIVLRANDGVALSLSGTSSTNVQVEGVDEADLIETDGEYLYILSGNDLVIVEAGIGEELRVASRVRLDEKPVGMYLDGNRLVLISTSARSYGSGFGNSIRFFDDVNFNYYSSPPTTTVTVLDITDRTAPAVVQKTEMDGQLVASRVVDGELRLVLNHSFQLPPPQLRAVEGETTPLAPIETPVAWPGILLRGQLMLADTDDVRVGGSNSTQFVYETKEEYLARVMDEVVAAALPKMRAIGLDGEVTSESSLVDVVDVYRPDSTRARNVTTIVTFDLASNSTGPTDAKSVFTEQPAQVFATADGIYLFSQEFPQIGIAWDGISGPKTEIHKFDFDGGVNGIELAAKGEIDGMLLNQFAADEHDGFLRVVTSNSWGINGQSLFVLEQVGGRLNVVGTVNGIAPGEQVYSVRFVGDRAFVVTFRTVDPLYALDLSDPTDPKILGELKVPGYSDYMQPIDENHLLAIGRGADEATGLFQELQVSIFNIADLSDPMLVDRYAFDGGRGIATPVTGDRWQRGDGDHHAVSYFADAGVFALPIINTGDSGWWWAGGEETVSPLAAGEGGLQLFQIDVTTGFTSLGLIQHETPIERSVRIGQHLYAISSGTISVHELTNPTIELASLDFSGESESSLTELTAFVAPLFESRWFTLATEMSAAATGPSVSLFALPHMQTSRPVMSSQAMRPAFQEAFSQFAEFDDLLLTCRREIVGPSRPITTFDDALDEAVAEIGEWDSSIDLDVELEAEPDGSLAGI